jgi:drug/metabolite transporter (DMT)-like permease
MSNEARKLSPRSQHQLGVVCGLAAGAWLGMAEAPTKLVTAGLSPFLISLGMVAGVFVARWTVPMVLKGTAYVVRDIREKPHLIVWAILAGALWAVANTLTVFAIREVGLSIAFPLWNTNSLIGLLWGWLLFGELSGSGQWGRVLGGALAIAVGACLLAYATALHAAGGTGHVGLGIAAALGAGLMWGTMYIPYRKAYVSGMNPLSFVTIFTFGELGSVLTLAAAFEGGFHRLALELSSARPALFWLFLGGFCWVLGDLFQQYAAKYIGLGRGIPLSNTNQLWGLAWGALVFGETAGMSAMARGLVLGGSVIIAAGAWAISSAEVPDAERVAWKRAVEREHERYGVTGESAQESNGSRRSGWEMLVAVAAIGILVWLASMARAQAVPVNGFWIAVLFVAAVGFLVGGGVMLWRRTRFS